MEVISVDWVIDICYAQSYATSRPNVRAYTHMGVGKRSVIRSHKMRAFRDHLLMTVRCSIQNSLNLRRRFSVSLRRLGLSDFGVGNHSVSIDPCRPGG